VVTFKLTVLQKEDFDRLAGILLTKYFLGVHQYGARRNRGQDNIK
jgi:hypothetical protein